MRQNSEIVTSLSLGTDMKLNMINKRPSINCRSLCSACKLKLRLVI